MGISHANITAFDSVVIEDNVLIGSGVKIWDTDFHSVDYLDRMQEPDTHVQSASVIIKEGAFIGACAIILKGVIVGKHSVIGAWSVVTKNVPDNEVWAGNPAKFIKSLNNNWFILNYAFLDNYFMSVKVGCKMMQSGKAVQSVCCLFLGIMSIR